jgi:plastocyanin
MRKRIFISVGVVAALALAGAAVGALAGRSTVTKTTLRVTEREYKISLSTRSLPAGAVRLLVHNAGHVAHRLTISGPGLSTATTPTIQPGATKSLTVTLGGGSFQLWCPLGSHAAAGMKTSLSVRGAAPPPSTTSTDPAMVPGAGDGYGY